RRRQSPAQRARRPHRVRPPEGFPRRPGRARGARAGRLRLAERETIMSEDTSPVERLPASKLQSFIECACVKVGIPAEDASVIAELMTRADVNGSDGHGIFRLPQYVRRIKGGAVNVRPN